MVGSVDEQFNNLIAALEWVNTNNPTPHEVYAWLRSEFGLSHYFGLNVYTVLLVSSGLVDVQKGKCHLTSDGQVILATRSPVVLLEAFEKTFAGVAAFLEVLRNNPHIKTEKLYGLWFEIVKERFPRMKSWSKRTLNNQCRHRINWLRTMGFVTTGKGLYSLSQSGWLFVQKHPPEGIAIQQHEVEQQEKQLKELVSEVFRPFDMSIEKTLSLRKSFVRGRAFREIVSTQYNYHCAVCDFCLSTPDENYEAEAAHIVPKHKRGTDDPRNGICLCGVCHWLFDEGVVSINVDDTSVMVAKYLNDVTNDKSVQRVVEFQGKKIRAVKDSTYSPAIEALDWHNTHIFLG
jgi:hypothetical protein